LPQKESYGRNQSHDAVDDQQEYIEDSSAPWRVRENYLVESVRRLGPGPQGLSRSPEARLPTSQELNRADYYWEDEQNRHLAIGAETT
jgi:hypothetical protein